MVGDVHSTRGTSITYLCLYLPGVPATDHTLLEYSFTSVQRCHVCQELLLGLVRQGLQCRGVYSQQWGGQELLLGLVRQGLQCRGVYSQQSRGQELLLGLVEHECRRRHFGGK